MISSFEPVSEHLKPLKPVVKKKTVFLIKKPVKKPFIKPVFFMNIQVTSLTFFLAHFFTIFAFTHNGMTKPSVNICCNQRTLFIMIDTNH